MLQFGRIGMTRPESFPKKFNLYRQDTNSSDYGRVLRGTPRPIEELRCILSVAQPEEVERFKQMKVTVTHTIFHRGAPVAKENDILKLVKNGKETRTFRVSAIHDKGEMDIDTTYYCEERGDLK